jgi:hypothetical protein
MFESFFYRQDAKRAKVKPKTKSILVLALGFLGVLGVLAVKSF